MDAPELFDHLGTSLFRKKQSSMFGIPCFKIGRRPFIMFYENHLVCMLFDEAHAEAIGLEGATLFNPKGNAKAMGNWVQIPFAHADQWERFAIVAHDVVARM